MRAELSPLDRLLQLRGAGHRGAGEGGDQVAFLEPGRLGRRVGKDFGDQHAAVGPHAELGGQIVIHLGDGHAQIRPGDGTMLDQLAGHPFGQIAGDRKADPLIRAVVGGDRRIDAHHLAVKIHQGAAGIARVDRRVGLQVFGPLAGRQRPLGAADDPLC